MGIKIEGTDEGTRVVVRVEGLGRRGHHAVGKDPEETIAEFKEIYWRFCERFDWDDLEPERDADQQARPPAKPAQKSEIEKLDFPTRALSAFESEGIKTLSAIPRDKQSLTKLEGMGDKTAQDVLDVIWKSGESMQLEDPFIGKLELSGRAFSALWRNGIKRLSQIPDSKDAISKIDGCGATTAKEIIEKVQRYR